MMAKPQQARKEDNILPPAKGPPVKGPPIKGPPVKGPPVKGPPATDGVWDHTENFKFL
jgi:hypothetical protein